MRPARRVLPLALAATALFGTAGCATGAAAQVWPGTAPVELVGAVRTAPAMTGGGIVELPVHPRGVMWTAVTPEGAPPPGAAKLG